MLASTLTMLYDAMIHKPVTKLLCLFSCRGFTFLDKPIEEF
jgi:hypothetical protein